MMMMIFIIIMIIIIINIVKYCSNHPYQGPTNANIYCSWEIIFEKKKKIND